MDINQSSLSRYQTTGSEVSRSLSEAKSQIDASRLKGASQAVNIRQLDLKEGQLVRGQIIDQRYNAVSIQLEPSKQIVTARLSGDVALTIGQNAQFQVTDNASEQMVLKYIPSGTTAPADATVLKALTASSLASTDLNKAIVSELLNQRMPVDKQTIQTLLRYSYANRDVSPLTLVLMYKNKIPLTKENILQFEAYQNGTNKLLNDIRSISGNITELLQSNGDALTENFADSASVSRNNAAPPMEQQLQSSTTLQENAQSKDVMLPELSRHMTETNKVIQMNGKLLEILYQNSNTTANSEPGSTLQSLLSPDEKLLLAKTVTQQLSKDALISAGLPADTAEQVMNGTLGSDQVSKLLEQLKPQTASSISDTLTKLQNQSAAPESYKLTVSDLLDPSQRSLLLDNLKDFPDENGMKNQLANGNTSLEEAFHYIQDNLKNANAETVGKLLRSPEYTKLLEGAFQEKWTLTPEKLAQKTPVMDLYQNLQKDIEQIEKLAKANREASEALQMKEPMKNLSENLSFMKDLNEMFTFLPLPLQLKNKQLQSDLYVFTNKKSLREKKDEISVLLHLDMENLGPLNIHIQMQQGNISAKFSVEDQEAGQLLGNNLPLLEETLERRGYHLKAELVDTYEEPNFSKDFIEQNSHDHAISRFTFDIRT